MSRTPREFLVRTPLHYRYDEFDPLRHYPSRVLFPFFSPDFFITPLCFPSLQDLFREVKSSFFFSFLVDYRQKFIPFHRIGGLSFFIILNLSCTLSYFVQLKGDVPSYLSLLLPPTFDVPTKRRFFLLVSFRYPF